MTAHTLTVTTTDPLGATATDGLVVNSTASAPMRKVRRSFLQNRVLWGSVIDSSPKGPTFSDAVADGYPFYTPGDPITIAQCFEVAIPVTFTGCRIYKAPNATGTAIPVKIWSGVDTGVDLGTATMDWVVDGGGWRQVTFATPVDLTPGTTYTVGYYSADAIYPYTPWVWHAQATVVWPLINLPVLEVSGTNTRGNAVWYGVSGIAFPQRHTATNFYIDPQVEWTDPLPGFDGGIGYWNQWTVPYTRHAFPVAVYNADPEWVSDYYDMGVNTLLAGGPVGNNGDAYIAAMNAMGNTMDWWPSIGGVNPADIVKVMTAEPGIEAQVVGYQLDDEPDMSFPYRSPDLLRGWVNAMRQVDSTRPFYMGFGLWAVRNQGFGWSPSGATPQLVNQLWRDWAACADMISCDDYAWWDDNDAGGLYGVRAYADQVGRMRELCDDAKPVWVTIETTSQIPGAPDPENIRKGVWAGLIAGARGVNFFDHRFASDYVTQDFAAMLHDPPMKAMCTALAARLQTLGPALLSPDTGLVTAWTSSNTTAGPMGGEFGTRMHYTTRSDGSYDYLFAQAIRPGATTATFTIPAWAGETVTVIDESRTVTVGGAGVLTDTFAADYTVHLYQRSV